MEYELLSNIRRFQNIESRALRDSIQQKISHNAKVRPAKHPMSQANGLGSTE